MAALMKLLHGKEIKHRLMGRQDEAEALQYKLEHEVATRESQHKMLLQQLKLEKERYTEEARKED